MVLLVWENLKLPTAHGLEWSFFSNGSLLRIKRNGTDHKSHGLETPDLFLYFGFIFLSNNNFNSPKTSEPEKL